MVRKLEFDEGARKSDVFGGAEKSRGWMKENCKIL